MALPSARSPTFLLDHGQITAYIDLPSRMQPQRVVVRFRHPTAAVIKSVMVNGISWTRFSQEKEFIELEGLRGKVAITASY